VILTVLLAAATFSHDVAPILYRQCASCHRSGGVAPFPLVSYQDTAKHAAQIAAVTRKRFMPPWLPSAPHFKGERKLSDAEIATLGAWAAAGAPQGNPDETPKPPAFPEGWQLGKPDAEAEMRAPFDVPAEGLDVYQCFDIRDPSPRARYLRAVDIKPGNPKVVHHALLFQDTTGTARKRDTGGGYPCFGTPGFLPAHGLSGWTPGGLPFQTPPGLPGLLHGNADLVLQVHYHPTGKPEQDRTRIALYYTDEVPKRHAQDIPLGSADIDIPAGDRAYKVTDHFTIPVDVEVIGINPHAHYVCTGMYGYAVLPDGKRITLIHIPHWDFNWQQQYLYPTPLRLPAETEVRMEFTYDNSANNPRNPHQPPQRVRYGPGSNDEMAGLHLTVVPVDPDDAEELSQTLWGKMMRALAPRR
jgi:hypothetical protein